MASPEVQTPAALTGLILACYRRVFRTEMRHTTDTERLVASLAQELRSQGCQLRWEADSQHRGPRLVINHTVLVWLCAARSLPATQVSRLRQTVLERGLAAGLLLSTAGARPLHRRIMAPDAATAPASD